MLNAAMVLMILAGIFGLPAAACSGACAGIGAGMGARNDPSAAGGQAIMEGLAWIGFIASIGAIVIGALVKRVKKAVAGGSALLFSAMFASLMIQANFMGLLPAIMLLVAAIMIFVAPAHEFRDVVRTEPT